MPFTQPWFEVSFGRFRTGIATVGYRLYKNDGTDSVARTTTGVVEVGNGAYGVASVNVPDDAVGIEWDTGAVPFRWAHEDIDPFRKRNSGGGLVDGTLTVNQALKVILAAVATKSSGGGTATITFRDVDDTADVLEMTVDVNGNRSSVTLTP